MKRVLPNNSSEFGIKVLLLLTLLALLCASLVFYCYQELQALFPLPLFAFVPILLALSIAATWKQSILAALVCAMAFGLLTLHGFENYGFGPYLAAAIFLGSQYFLYFAFFYQLKKRCLPALAQAMLSATGFIAIDFLYSNMPFGPTGRYAAALSYDELFAQIVGLTGPAGLSFALIFANTIFAQAIFDSKNLRSHRCGLITVVVLFLAIYGYGHFALAKTETDTTAIDFAIIQGGVTKQQYDAMSGDYEAWALVRDRYFTMTREAHALGHHNILWPETAIRSYVGVKEDLVQLLQSLNQPLFGGFPLLIEQSGVQYNSALQLDANAEVVGRYDKNHLLPFAESEFTSGADAAPMTATFQRKVADKVIAESVVVATPICLEVLFPNFIRAMSNKGAQLIVVLTNDAGFGFTSISALVQKQAVLRAIENNKYLIRVAQSGISSVISNRGAVMVQTGIMQRQIVPLTVHLHNRQTIYAKFGEWFLLLMVVAAIAIVRANNSNVV